MLELGYRLYSLEWQPPIARRSIEWLIDELAMDLALNRWLMASLGFIITDRGISPIRAGQSAWRTETRQASGNSQC